MLKLQELSDYFYLTLLYALTPLVALLRVLPNPRKGKRRVGVLFVRTNNLFALDDPFITNSKYGAFVWFCLE